jgi:hypothetical protein
MVKEELTDRVVEVRRNSARVIVVVMLIVKVTVRVISGCIRQQGRKKEKRTSFMMMCLRKLGKQGLMSL